MYQIIFTAIDCTSVMEIKSRCSQDIEVTDDRIWWYNHFHVFVGVQTNWWDFLGVFLSHILKRSILDFYINYPDMKCNEYCLNIIIRIPIWPFWNYSDMQPIVFLARALYPFVCKTVVKRWAVYCTFNSPDNRWTKFPRYLFSFPCRIWINSAFACDVVILQVLHLLISVHLLIENNTAPTPTIVPLVFIVCLSVHKLAPSYQKYH